MLTVTTEGVQVGVETSFQREFNKNNQSEFVFAYRITIHNEGSYAVQLMRRHWYVLILVE